MNCDMKSVESWLIANKLTLNVKKKRYMLIGNHLKVSRIHNNFTVRVSYTPLERVLEYKSSEVHTDDSLTWRPHIDAISKKI